MTTKQRKALAALFALVVAALCGAHYFLWFERVSGELRAELKKYQTAQAKLSDLEKQILDFDKKKLEQTSKNETQKRVLSAIELQRLRFGKLFARLSEQTDEELLVRKIDAPGGEPCIHGWCLQPQAPAHLAYNLTESSAILGWSALAPKSKAQEKLPGGGPWEFDLQLRDVILAADATPTKTKGPRGASR